jgi:hypothetical protein
MPMDEGPIAETVDVEFLRGRGFSAYATLHAGKRVGSGEFLGV